MIDVQQDRVLNVWSAWWSPFAPRKISYQTIAREINMRMGKKEYVLQ